MRRSARHARCSALLSRRWISVYACSILRQSSDGIRAALVGRQLFGKAVRSESPYKTDPAAYHRLGISILKGEFAKLSAEYNEKFGGKPASLEQTAMLQRITHLIEQTIDAYARAVALSTKPEQKEARDKIMAQLTALYKNVHNNSDLGLNELIAGVLSKPMP